MTVTVNTNVLLMLAFKKTNRKILYFGSCGQPYSTDARVESPRLSSPAARLNLHTVNGKFSLLCPWKQDPRKEIE